MGRTEQFCFSQDSEKEERSPALFFSFASSSIETDLPISPLFFLPKRSKEKKVRTQDAERDPSKRKLSEVGKISFPPLHEKCIVAIFFTMQDGPQTQVQHGQAALFSSTPSRRNHQARSTIHSFPVHSLFPHHVEASRGPTISVFSSLLPFPL